MKEIKKITCLACKEYENRKNDEANLQICTNNGVIIIDIFGDVIESYNNLVDKGDNINDFIDKIQNEIYDVVGECRLCEGETSVNITFEDGKKFKDNPMKAFQYLINN